MNDEFHASDEKHVQSWLKINVNGNTSYIFTLTHLQHAWLRVQHLLQTSSYTWRHTFCRLQHAPYLKWDGHHTCSNHRRSTCASFSMSQSGHQKPWRAQTRYLAFACLFLLSIFSPISSLHCLSVFVSLFYKLTHCQPCIIGG